MKRLINLFAVLGLIYFCVFVFMNGRMLLQSPNFEQNEKINDSAWRIKNSFDCDAIVRNQSGNQNIKTKFIELNCDDEISRIVEIAKIQDGKVLEKQHFTVIVDENTQKDVNVFPIILSDTEIVISHSENANLPMFRDINKHLEFANFKVSASIATISEQTLPVFE